MKTKNGHRCADKYTHTNTRRRGINYFPSPRSGLSAWTVKLCLAEPWHWNQNKHNGLTSFLQRLFDFCSPSPSFSPHTAYVSFTNKCCGIFMVIAGPRGQSNHQFINKNNNADWFTSSLEWCMSMKMCLNFMRRPLLFYIFAVLNHEIHISNVYP